MERRRYEKPKLEFKALLAEITAAGPTTGPIAPPANGGVDGGIL